MFILQHVKWWNKRPKPVIIAKDLHRILPCTLRRCQQPFHNAGVVSTTSSQWIPVNSESPSDPNLYFSIRIVRISYCVGTSFFLHLKGTFSRPLLLLCSHPPLLNWYLFPLPLYLFPLPFHPTFFVLWMEVFLLINRAWKVHERTKSLLHELPSEATRTVAVGYNQRILLITSHQPSGDT